MLVFRRVIPRPPGRLLLALLHPGLPTGGRGGQRLVPFSGGWGTQEVEWLHGRVALFKIRAERQCPPSTASGRRHEGRWSLRSGDEQDGASAAWNRVQRWKWTSQVSRAGAKKASCSLLPRPLPSRHTRDVRQGEEGSRRGQAAQRQGETIDSRWLTVDGGESRGKDLSSISCATIRGYEMNGLMMAVSRYGNR